MIHKECWREARRLHKPTKNLKEACWSHEVDLKHWLRLGEASRRLREGTGNFARRLGQSAGKLTRRLGLVLGGVGKTVSDAKNSFPRLLGQGACLPGLDMRLVLETGEGYCYVLPLH